ncbi:MAG: dihydropteroate synthase [Armatimonadetes bacterium]|nr:dihydropteroate synthase [Armatimonadota bacterium]
MKFWHCGTHRLEIGRKTYVMGIVNATPDSFSNDGNVGEAALERALQMTEEGADLLDIGGESTRPGAVPVSLDEELRRVVPLIETLAARVQIPLSVDTTKSVVARRAVEAGASIVNDISGATFDPQMLQRVSETQAGLILMHLRGTPQSMKWSERAGLAPSSNRLVETRLEEGASPAPDIIAEILQFWANRLDAARKCGIADERIAFDAGFGFGKSVEENLEIIRRGRELADFGFPTLSATSRKSTVGKILGDAPVDERLWGSAAAAALAIAGGAALIRVHDVREMAQVTRICDAVVRQT